MDPVRLKKLPKGFHDPIHLEHVTEQVHQMQGKNKCWTRHRIGPCSFIVRLADERLFLVLDAGELSGIEPFDVNKFTDGELAYLYTHGVITQTEYRQFMGDEVLRAATNKALKDVPVRTFEEGKTYYFLGMFASQAYTHVAWDTPNESANRKARAKQRNKDAVEKARAKTP